MRVAAYSAERRRKPYTAIPEDIPNSLRSHFSDIPGGVFACHLPTTAQILRKHPLKQRVAGIGMNFVVPEAFTEENACSRAAGACPDLHLPEMIVYPVLLSQPRTLTAVLGEHRGLRLKCGCDIDREIRNRRISATVSLIDRVHEV